MTFTLKCLCGAVLLTLIGAMPASAQESAKAQAALASEPVERIFQSVIAGKPLDEHLSGHIPELIQIVENGDPESCTLALHTLAQMKSAAASATRAISKRLSDSSHAIRSTAVDALVAVGDSSVEPLTKLLTFTSATTRAGAAHALCKLGKLDLAQLERLCGDVDPRVRAVAADGLSRSGKAGIHALARLLADPETAVAVEAARGLRVNREDPSVAIPKLTETLPRQDLGAFAARALAAYGIEARRAVPWIIKAYPLGELDSFESEDAAEVALKHIGPPDAADLALVCESLKHEDPEARIMAADALASMGLQSKAAAQALEDAARAALREYLAFDRKHASQPEAVPRNFGRFLYVAEGCSVAIWRVSHDARRYLDAIEKLVPAGDGSISFSVPIPEQKLSAEESRLFEGLMHSANANVRRMALVGMSETGVPSGDLRQMVVALARADDTESSRLAIGVLAATGGSVTDDAAPIVLAKFRDGTLSLVDFADAVKGLNIRAPEFQAILENGLMDNDQRTMLACARALRATSAAPRRIASVIVASASRGFVEAAGNGRIDSRTAIAILKQFDSAPDVVIPFLVGLLDDHDRWARYEAIEAIGSFGQAANATVELLRAKLTDESDDIQLMAAKALFQITGDVQPFDDRLKSAFADRDRTNDWNEAVKLITSLGHDGSRFLPYIVASLQSSEPEVADDLIDALAAMGKDDSLATLKKYVEMTSGLDYYFDREIVFWILRLLFEPIRLGDRMPPPLIAVILDDSSVPKGMKWPLNPIEVIEGIPFMVGRQVAMGGTPENPLSHIIWARRHGVLRDGPLVPTTNPLSAAEPILTSRRFQALDEFERDAATSSLRRNAVAMIKDLVQPANVQQFGGFDDDEWKACLEKARRLGIRWDAQREQFVATNSTSD